MKKIIKNPFMWTTVILIIGIIVYVAVNRFEYNIPYTVLDINDTEIKQYVNLYRTVDEMRESQKHCNSAANAMEIVLEWHKDIFKDRDKDKDVFVVHNAEESLYFILFSLKNQNRVLRIAIDEYTGAVIEVAKIK